MKIKKGTTSKEAYKVIMHDLECLDLDRDNKKNEYHYNLLVGNLKDLFGVADRKLKKYILIDIYGDEWVYLCGSKKDARECFNVENGKERFESFLINKNKDYIND